MSGVVLRRAGACPATSTTGSTPALALPAPVDPGQAIRISPSLTADCSRSASAGPYRRARTPHQTLPLFGESPWHQGWFTYRDPYAPRRRRQAREAEGSPSTSWPSCPLTYLLAGDRARRRLPVLPSESVVTRRRWRRRAASPAAVPAQPPSGHPRRPHVYGIGRWTCGQPKGKHQGPRQGRVSRRPGCRRGRRPSWRHGVRWCSSSHGSFPAGGRPARSWPGGRRTRYYRFTATVLAGNVGQFGYRSATSAPLPTRRCWRPGSASAGAGVRRADRAGRGSAGTAPRPTPIGRRRRRPRRLRAPAGRRRATIPLTVADHGSAR